MTSAAPPSPTSTLTLLTTLLTSTPTLQTYQSRWQNLRTKLSSLKSLISEISTFPHWSSNPLLLPLLSSVLSTLRRLVHLSSTSSPTRGKLLMQSDLDMSSAWLTKQISDIELLIRSGVLNNSTALVLSKPTSNSVEEFEFFIKDLFARIQIGGLEFKVKGLESLIQILTEPSSVNVGDIVAKEGNVSYLISLLDSSSKDSIRELAVNAVSLLVSISDLSRKCVFEEGGLGPLLRVVEFSSMLVKEKAALAVEVITSDPDNAWAVSAYGGVSILIELCKCGSDLAKEYAVGAIRNVSVVEDVRFSLAEEGVVPVLMDLVVSGSGKGREKAASCVAIFASSGEYFQGLLLCEQGLLKLLDLFYECSSLDVLEHVLRAIYSLSASDTSYRVLSGSSAFILRIAELVRDGNVTLQHISASLLANLSISDGNKKAIGGCMSSLVKMMECVKPEGMQEVGAKALVSLLSVKCNRKEFVSDEKSLMRLVQMLDGKNEVVSKKFPVAVVSAIMAGGSQGCRKKLVAAGAYGHLQRLAEKDVTGAKKALQRLSANRLTSLFTRTWLE